MTGSEIAKSGFNAEKDIVELLNKNNLPSEIVCGNKKTDVISGDKVYKIQVKSFDNPTSFQQLDRHPLKYFTEKIPEIPEDTIENLRECFEFPIHNGKVVKPEKRKLLSSEKIDRAFNQNKRKILNYACFGDDLEHVPNFLFALNKSSGNLDVYYYPELFEYFCEQDFSVSNKETTIRLGEGVITIQRKGGDCGEPCSNNIQFKITISKIHLEPFIKIKLLSKNKSSLTNA